MKEEYLKLKKKYGSHTRVAERLGLSQRQYARIRNGQTPPKKSMLYMIKHLLVDIDQTSDCEIDPTETFQSVMK